MKGTTKLGFAYTTCSEDHSLTDAARGHHSPSIGEAKLTLRVEAGDGYAEARRLSMWRITESCLSL